MLCCVVLCIVLYLEDLASVSVNQKDLCVLVAQVHRITQLAGRHMHHVCCGEAHGLQAHKATTQQTHTTENHRHANTKGSVQKSSRRVFSTTIHPRGTAASTAQWHVASHYLDGWALWVAGGEEQRARHLGDDELLMHMLLLLVSAVSALKVRRA